MRFRNLLICSALCSIGLCGQAPTAGPRDPHENPASPVNADENSQLPPSSKPGSSPTKAQKNKKVSASSARYSGTNAQDRAFLATAAKAGREEVQLAQRMVDQASNPEVKAFAQKLVMDHTPANQELEAWARQKGIDLPAETPLPTSPRPMSDKIYISSEITNHRKAIQLFEKEASAGLDKDLRGFAANMLPGLQQHLKMAKSIQSGGSPLSKNLENDSTPNSGPNHSITPVTSSTPAISPSTTTSTYTPKVAHPPNTENKSTEPPVH